MYIYIYIYIYMHPIPQIPVQKCSPLHLYTNIYATPIYIHTHKNMLPPRCIWIIAYKYTHICYTYMHTHLYRPAHTYRYMHYCTWICAPKNRRTYGDTHLYRYVHIHMQKPLLHLNMCTIIAPLQICAPLLQICAPLLQICAPLLHHMCTIIAPKYVHLELEELIMSYTSIDMLISTCICIIAPKYVHPNTEELIVSHLYKYTHSHVHMHYCVPKGRRA